MRFVRKVSFGKVFVVVTSFSAQSSGPMFTISVSVERKRKAQLAKLFVETGVTLEARRLSPDVTVTS